MTTTTPHAPNWWSAPIDAGAHTDPPRPRATPPLLMGDILMSSMASGGVPVFVDDWLRLERERDARRAARKGPNTD